MEKITNLDKTLFHHINSGYASPLLDQIMLFLSGPYPWVVLLSGILIWGFYKHRLAFAKVALILVALVSLTDLIAYRVLKPNIARHRPCIELKEYRAIKSCGGEFGFPSNHSANAVAIACFLHLYYRRWLMTLLLAAFVLLIGVSRIYLGAHYPLDVLAGYLLGAIVASGVYFLGRKYWRIA